MVLFLGGLLGDAFLHLIPHAMMASGGEDHGHSHSHGHSHGGDDGAEEGHVHDLRYYPPTHFSSALFWQLHAVWSIRVLNIQSCPDLVYPDLVDCRDLVD